MFRPANKSTLHNDVLEQMIDAILKGVWVEGSRLPGEQALADQFKVSRNCIREVLKALALSGIVEAFPGSGTFLSSNALRQLNGNKLATTMFDETSLQELMEVRCLIEGQIAYWVAERATDTEIENLGKVMKKYKSVTDNHAIFHSKLSQIVGNKLLSRLLESIGKELDLSRQRYKKLATGTLEEYTMRHVKIYECIKARDSEGARKAMVEHIIYAWQDLIRKDEIRREKKI